MINKKSEIKKLLSVFDEHLPKDSRVTIIFLIFSLLTPVPSIRLGKSTLRPPRENITENFLIHAVDEEDDLDAKLLKKKKFLEQFKLSNQPVVVVIGSDVKTIKKSIVVINNINYEAKSTLEAIDIAFKSFFSLQIKYPEIAENIWRAIQEKFYEIHVPGDKPLTSTITNLLSFLKQAAK
ncbi:hypothetical protein HCN44_003416 [Aphidius gifuensis]|uniref:Uncharacterized protein n=1 Tax=Aphidius gifuensis TaxID=684658 RepID=A0A834XY51_APHGI|nr:hypothetical protein HCN44_003416 [Aphidius gifuensis]